MIKANELRIGNLVAIAGRALEIIWFNLDNALVRTTDSASNTMYANIYKMEGVPLSEEVFTSLGFAGDYLDHQHIGYFHRDYLDIYYRKRRTEPGVYMVFVDDTRIAFVQYVHEVQNLIFALNRSELTLK